MKTSISLVTSMVLWFGSVTAAHAATDREIFQKQVAKVAPPSAARPKALCACSSDSGGGFANRVGFIRQHVLNNQVFVRCTGDSFDADGNDIGGFSCEMFYPLVK